MTNDMRNLVDAEASEFQRNIQRHMASIWDQVYVWQRRAAIAAAVALALAVLNLAVWLGLVLQ